MRIDWNKHGIDPGKVIGGKTFCPKCHERRKHRRDKSLSVDLQTGMFNCHNPGCGFRGCAVVVERKKQFSKPAPRLEKLDKKALTWFEQERKISNNTLLRFGITESLEWMPQFEKEVKVICFNYYRDEQLVNIKFRGPQKTFKMSKDAELIFYNLDSIKDETEVVIVEGEIDCLSFYEAGIYNVVSVPNGASEGNLRLEYLENCWNYFDLKERIYIATDADRPGEVLCEELARRLGKERIYKINYPEGCKDANDVLIKHGKEKVVEIKNKATLWPLEGIATVEELYSTVADWYEKGYPKGDKAGVPGLDPLLTFVPKQITTITGIPSHGKDEYTNWVMASLAVNADWSWGDCGFEEEPEQTITKLVEKITGKSFAVRKDPSQRVSISDFERAIAIIDNHFYFYKTEEIETDIDSLLKIADGLVLRYGIKGLRLNPWNFIDNNSGVDGTEYVSIAYSKIIKWARKRGVHVFVIAHTTKIQKDKNGKFEIPNLYNISGSAHFFNKTHNGITVYLDSQTRIVTVYIQKVKQSWLGQKGYSSYNYDVYTRQYYLLECQPNHPEAAKESVRNQISELGDGSWQPVSLPYKDN